MERFDIYSIKIRKNRSLVGKLSVISDIPCYRTECYILQKQNVILKPTVSVILHPPTKLPEG